MRTLFTAVLISITALSFVYPQQSKGHLVIIGGGKRHDYMMEKIIELAGGPDSKIVIIPTASSEPQETAEYQKKQFEEFGAENVHILNCTNIEADMEKFANVLKDADGVFLSGGDQRRLVDSLLDTEVYDELMNVYYRGGVVSGTSAGAAVMSEIMITGDEIINEDPEKAFTTIQAGNIKTVRGYGLLKTAIIDQHFVYRKRNNRLISIVLENPALYGIGIDEESSIVVYPDDTFEVMGEYQVIVYDATDAANIKKNERGLLSAENLKMQILFNGDKFDLKTGKVIE